MESNAAENVEVRKGQEAPIAIYEVHLGSWMRVPEEGNRPLTYQEIAPKLADHVERLGFTHVELLPLAEHPPAHADPKGLALLVETLGQRGVGVILDGALQGSGGEGLELQRDAGWTHETLEYLASDPIHRRWQHAALIGRNVHPFEGSFVLPLPHDEVERGRGSLLSRMHGDRWQKFANLRLLYAYQWTLPGKKLLFMGGEFGQWQGWDRDASLDWHILEDAAHRQVQHLVGELNQLYRSEPRLHRLDCDPEGFAWLGGDAELSVIAYERTAPGELDPIVVVLNFTPVPRANYRVGVARGGQWDEILNTDAATFGGSGHGNLGEAEATPVPWHGHGWSINLTLPPLGAIVLRRRGTSVPTGL